MTSLIPLSRRPARRNWIRGRCRTAFALVVFTLIGGCFQQDSPSRLHDLRVLGVVTEPAEILVHPVFLAEEVNGQPFPPGVQVATMSVDVFAYDPRGGVVEITTAMCPPPTDDSPRPCHGFDVDTFAPDVTERESIDGFFAEETNRFSIVDDGARPEGQVPTRTRTVTFTLGVTRAFLQAESNVVTGVDQPALGLSPEGTGSGLESIRIPFYTPVLPRILVDVRNDDAPPHEVGEELAFKRVPVGVDLSSFFFADPAFTDVLENATGIPMCAPEEILPSGNWKLDDDGNIVDEEGELTGFALGETDCLWPRRANVNPILRGMIFFSDARPERLIVGKADVPPEATIFVRRGEPLVIAPAFELYPEIHQTLTYDTASESLVINNVVEDYAATFAATAGSVDRDSSVALLDKGLAVGWILPTSRAIGDRDTLIMVVRDQRGGTSVARLTVVYE